jgi:hypothetical protein
VRFRVVAFRKSVIDVEVSQSKVHLVERSAAIGQGAVISSQHRIVLDGSTSQNDDFVS